MPGTGRDVGLGQDGATFIESEERAKSPTDYTDYTDVLLLKSV